MCNKVGMQLASVHSDTEMTLLMSLVSQAKVTDQTFTPNIWLGMTQGGTQGRKMDPTYSRIDML